jgi:hypothetical protein
MTSSENILNFLDIQALMGNMDHETLYRVSAMRDGEEAEGELLASDIMTVLAERREAIELLAAAHRGEHVHTAVGDFLATIKSDA